LGRKEGKRKHARALVRMRKEWPEADDDWTTCQDLEARTQETPGEKKPQDADQGHRKATEQTGP